MGDSMEASWVLIPAHNNSDLLQACLISVLNQTIPTRVFIINNGSEDNIPNVLAGLDNKHIVVNAYPQLGVAGAWNYGLRYLFGEFHKGDFQEVPTKVLIVNQDVILRQDTYEILNNEPGEFVTAVSTGRMDKLFGDIRKPVGGKRLHPDFSCFRITKRCYETVGPFDEGFYPAYAEDCDYHVRMHRKGVEAYCVDLPFYHYGAATVKRANDAEALYFMQSADRNRELFYTKYGAHIGTPAEYETLFTPDTFGIDI